MYHHSEDHPDITDEVTEAGALMSKAEPEVYATFLSFQESLMKPYTTVSGKVPSDNVYEKMLDVAATLTSACAVIAAAEVQVNKSNTSDIN